MSEYVASGVTAGVAVSAPTGVGVPASVGPDVAVSIGNCGVIVGASVTLVDVGVDVSVNT